MHGEDMFLISMLLANNIEYNLFSIVGVHADMFATICIKINQAVGIAQIQSFNTMIQGLALVNVLHHASLARNLRFGTTKNAHAGAIV